MNRREIKKIYRILIAKFGIEKQMLILMEECSELIKATTKYIRYGKSSAQPIRDLGEEIADVEIMIDQMKEYFKNVQGIDLQKSVDTVKHDKLLRLKKKIDEDYWGR